MSKSTIRASNVQGGDFCTSGLNSITRKAPPFARQIYPHLNRARQRWQNLTIRIQCGPQSLGTVKQFYQAPASVGHVPCILWLAWPGHEDPRKYDWSILQGFGAIGILPSAYTLPDWHKALLLLLWHDAGAKPILVDSCGQVWTVSDIPTLSGERAA